MGGKRKTPFTTIMPLLGENTETSFYPSNGQTYTADDAGDFEPVAIVGMGRSYPVYAAVSH